MKITGIIWLSEIVEKIERKHNVKQSEVWGVLKNKPQFRFVEKGYRTDENVYAALGRTDAGRYLIVFLIYKKNNQVLILSARVMTDAERRKYEQKQK